MTNMPKTLATLSAELSMNPDDENTIILTNTSNAPALMIRLNLCGNDGGAGSARGILRQLLPPAPWRAQDGEHQLESS